MSLESRRRILEWDSKLDALGYERVLGIPADASIEACRDAYYQFARAFHPDAHLDADPILRAALTRIFQRGAEAYRVLTDPVLRARWSAARQTGAPRLIESSRAPALDLEAELKALHPHCRSGGAKLCAQQAWAAFAKQRLDVCADQLRNALDYEGGANLYITRCLEAIEQDHRGVRPSDR